MRKTQYSDGGHKAWRLRCRCGRACLMIRLSLSFAFLHHFRNVVPRKLSGGVSHFAHACIASHELRFPCAPATGHLVQPVIKLSFWQHSLALDTLCPQMPTSIATSIFWVLSQGRNFPVFSKDNCGRCNSFAFLTRPRWIFWFSETVVTPCF